MKKSMMIPMLLCCLGSSAIGEFSVSPAGVQMVWDDGGEHFGNFKTFNTKKGIKEEEVPINLILGLEGAGGSLDGKKK